MPFCENSGCLITSNTDLIILCDFTHICADRYWKYIHVNILIWIPACRADTAPCSSNAYYINHARTLTHTHAHTKPYTYTQCSLLQCKNDQYSLSHRCVCVYLCVSLCLVSWMCVTVWVWIMTYSASHTCTLYISSFKYHNIMTIMKKWNPRVPCSKLHCQSLSQFSWWAVNHVAQHVNARCLPQSKCWLIGFTSRLMRASCVCVCECLRASVFCCYT